MDITKDMEKIIDQQNIKIKELQNKYGILKDIVERLIICKQYNEKHPYYEFTLNYGINPEQQCLIKRLFALLQERFDGNTLPARYKKTAELSVDYLFTDEQLAQQNIGH